MILNGRGLILAVSVIPLSSGFLTPDRRAAFRTSSSSQLYAEQKEYKHGLAILRMPSTSMDRIANEAILETAMQNADKLSVVLRSSDDSHSLASLRRYVGEVYSTLWDCSSDTVDLNDVVVYPQNLPNTAPEQWIHHREDLDMVCSHDSITGWYSESASGRGTFHMTEEGQGGLDDHVAAMNADREGRDLDLVEALHVDPWPKGASVEFSQENHVVFMDDEEHDVAAAPQESEDDDAILGGARIPSKSLFQCVCVGGTFDGLHYGHRKLLTLAVSSVLPQTGRLLIGVTVDDMLKNKKFAELIPLLDERVAGVRDFLDRLAPGMKNRVKIVPISDPYGPPGDPELGADFEALVLSHETLENGHLLNEHRLSLDMKPLVLLCTRRTEAYGMSSTTLRKRRSLANKK